MSITMAFTRPVLRAGADFGHAAESLWTRWRHARRVQETRRYLQQMDEHMLHDIGVSRAQALFELDRPDPRA